MPSLFRRKSAEPSEPAAADVAAAEQDALRGRTAKKGRATPKRAPVRRPVEPPPSDRREAARRLREKRRVEAAARRKGMEVGDERYLLPRDRGPERALVRDLVDSRRSVGSWFISYAFILLITGTVRLPPEILLGLNLTWMLLGLATLVDGFLVARRIGRLVRERFPRTEQRMGQLYAYGIMRGITFRRLRIPKPRVKIGQAV